MIKSDFENYTGYKKLNIINYGLINLTQNNYLGFGASLNAGAGPLQGSLSSDTSVHLADTKVEANLFKNQIAGNFGGRVGASYATGAGIDIGYDKRQRNIGTDITTPVGTFGGHLGCITEVCIGPCVNIRVC